jgi:hypothetical protein
MKYYIKNVYTYDNKTVVGYWSETYTGFIYEDTAMFSQLKITIYNYKSILIQIKNLNQIFYS